MSTITGNGRNNSIHGTSSSDWLYGLGGKDNIDGRAGDDDLSGNDGNDNLVGGSGDDSLYGGNGNDKLTGGDGDDYLLDYNGNNSILGGLGDDTIYGGSGRDKMSGGAGDDNLYSGDGNDSLSGDDGDDYLYGGNGIDKLTGGSGNDSLDGGAGKDRLTGGDGKDSLDGGEDGDRLDGGNGNDNLFGGNGADVLSGGNGNDRLDGGDDLVRDRLLGGAGDDTIAVHQSDVAMGGAGNDRLEISYYGFTDTEVAYHIDLSKITGKGAASIGHLDIKAGQFERAEVDLFGVLAGSSVVGSKGGDDISVMLASGAVTVHGGSGNDTLSVTTRGAGGSTVDGGSGDDKIYSNHSSDMLTGGKGSDLFVLSFGAKTDTITDFGGKDLLLIRDGYGFNNADTASLLVIGADPKATSAKGQFLYDTDDGKPYSCIWQNARLAPSHENQTDLPIRFAEGHHALGPLPHLPARLGVSPDSWNRARPAARQHASSYR